MEYLCDAPMEEALSGLLECENKMKLLDFYCKQNHFVEFGTRNAKATDKSLLQLLKTI
jgi:hypothetical protein